MPTLTPCLLCNARERGSLAANLAQAAEVATTASIIAIMATDVDYVVRHLCPHHRDEVEAACARFDAVAKTDPAPPASEGGAL